MKILNSVGQASLLLSASERKTNKPRQVFLSTHMFSIFVWQTVWLKRSDGPGIFCLGWDIPVMLNIYCIFCCTFCLAFAKRNCQWGGLSPRTVTLTALMSEGFSSISWSDHSKTTCIDLLNFNEEELTANWRWIAKNWYYTLWLFGIIQKHESSGRKLCSAWGVCSPAVLFSSY